jgi:hypothetical protein
VKSPNGAALDRDDSSVFAAQKTARRHGHRSMRIQVGLPARPGCHAELVHKAPRARSAALAPRRCSTLHTRLRRRQEVLAGSPPGSNREQTASPASSPRPDRFPLYGCIRIAAAARHIAAIPSIAIQLASDR